MRRRFRFSLARLLRVREIEERVARSEWGRAEAAARGAAEERGRRRGELEEARRDLVRLLLDGALPAWIERMHRTLDGQTAALARAHELALTRRAQADALAGAWRERERDRRALVELERRARDAHRRELERFESRESDERALLRRAAIDRTDARETDSSRPSSPSDEGDDRADPTSPTPTGS